MSPPQWFRSQFLQLSFWITHDCYTSRTTSPLPPRRQVPSGSLRLGNTHTLPCGTDPSRIGPRQVQHLVRSRKPVGLYVKRSWSMYAFFSWSVRVLNRLVKLPFPDYIRDGQPSIEIIESQVARLIRQQSRRYKALNHIHSHKTNNYTGRIGHCAIQLVRTCINRVCSCLLCNHHVAVPITRQLNHRREHPCGDCRYKTPTPPPQKYSC